MFFDLFRTTASCSRPPIIIAEIGTAHGGNLARGLELVTAAADAGADIVKVQVVFADEILPPEAGLVPLPGGNIPLYDAFRKLEKPVEFYAALAERATSLDIGFLASPFGEKSIRLLENIGITAWKVASPELNHEPMLERLAGTALPLILSTGVSRMEDIKRALEVIDGSILTDNTLLRLESESLKQAPPGVLSFSRNNHPTGSTSQIVLLHCLTSYPAPEQEANLRVIPTLAATFGHPVGLSDHSLDPVLIPSLATALGAVIIEKHITLNKEGGGLDDPVALTPGAFAEMTTAVRHFTPSCDSPESCEISGPDPIHLLAVIDELALTYNRERVEACLGDGKKRLAPSEEACYQRTNRSLHAVGPLVKGTLITEHNTAILRTEKLLRPGLEPRFRRKAYGHRLIRDVASGDGITLEDLAPEKR